MSDVVLVALIAAVPATIAAVASALSLRAAAKAAQKAAATHDIVNGRFLPLLEEARIRGIAIGRQQRDEERETE